MLLIGGASAVIRYWLFLQWSRVLDIGVVDFWKYRNTYLLLIGIGVLGYVIQQ